MRWVKVLAVFSGLLFAVDALAVYQPSQMPDPSRRWAVSLSLRQGFDDNANGSSVDKKGSATSIVEPRLYLNIPLDQTFIGLRYTYNMTYFWDRAGDDVDQAHIADVLFSHRFNPRLTLNINDSMRYGVQPELVESTISGPIVRRNEGDYWFNALSGSLTWSASRRWLLTLGEAWEHWEYTDEANADANNRDSFATSASAVYTLDPVSSLGVNVRFGMNRYETAGADDERDSQSETLYLSYTHVFSPKLTAQIAGGGGFSQFGNGDNDFSPYASASASYTYAPESTASLSLSYSFTVSDTASYRSSDTLVISPQISHRLSRKARVALGADYVRYDLQNPRAGFLLPSSTVEDAVRARVGFSYLFNRHLSADFNYYYERIWSDLGGRSYDRNRVSAGMSFIF